MFEEPSLPPLLGLSDAEEHRITRRSRKRCYDSSTSSDPPLFSSDDVREASSDNYVSLDRRKRYYKGTWWGERVTSTSAEIHEGGDKRKLVRNVDSGVWLGSDISDGSDATRSTYAASEESSGRDVDDAQERGHSSVSYEAAAPKGQASGVIASSGLTECVAKHIQSCLDNEIEIVDLAGFGLIDLSNETLRPLRYMTKPTKWRQQPPSQACYKPFTPSLQIFLSHNFLRIAPLELFHLHTLTVLSLRGNELIEVPPAIGTLVNLVELNLSCNRLRWLPWELLRLCGNKGKLLRLNVLANPFFRPVRPNSEVCVWLRDSIKALASSALRDLDSPAIEPGSEEGETYEYAAWRARVLRALADHVLAPRPPAVQSRVNGFGPSRNSESGIPSTWNRDSIYLGHTPVAFFHSNGASDRDSAAPPTLLPYNQLVLAPVFQKQSLTSKHFTSGAPSLLELALQSCCASPYAALIRRSVGGEIPDALRVILGETESLKTYGKNSCSVCGRGYIIPRSEWIEYWHYAEDDFISCDGVALPFLRRGCSWRCVPDPGADDGLVP